MFLYSSIHYEPTELQNGFQSNEGADWTNVSFSAEYQISFHLGVIGVTQRFGSSM